MDKAKLLKRLKELETQVNALLSDETRDYGPDEQKKVDNLCAKIDAINKRLESMDAEAKKASQRDDDKEGDDDETEDEASDEDEGDDDADKKKKEDEENALRAKAKARGPAAVRSKGRRSAPSDINDHARRNGFSVSRAVTQFIERGRLSGIEKETSDELTRTGSGSVSGGAFRIPFGDVRKLNRVNPERRDLTLTTGAGAVPVYTDGAEFIDYLYPMMVGPQLGFNYIEALAGVTKFPRQSSVPTVSAVAESTPGAGSQPGIDYVQFTPHTITANVTISRKFAMQSVVAADRYVMQAGSRQVAVQTDQWAISGDGASNRPTGLVNNTALTQFVYAASNTVAYGDTLAMKKQVAKANANFGNLGFLTSPAGYAKLAQTPKLLGTFPVFILNDETGQIGGAKTVQSSQVSDNVTYSGTSGLTYLIWGNWEFLSVAFFGNGVDVIVDPFTGSKQGDVTITFLLDVDTELLQPSAFSVIPNVGE